MWRHVLGVLGFVFGPIAAVFSYAYMAVRNRSVSFSVRPSGSGRPVRVYFGAKGIPKRFSAITNGHRIYARPLVTKATMTHEMHHVRQIEEMGFVKNAALYGYWLGRVGYNKHPFEQDARLAAGQPLR